MTDELPWWQSEVIYQIYPRSFQDGNDDGIGDLKGIIARLDYLRKLGVGGIWLSPIYPSPMYDFGYDVSDYTDISPEFGDMDDFKTLLDEAHKRGLKIILDLVLNHTSHKHSWFIESSSSKDSPKRDWYIWHDGRPGKKPPNNWLGTFGGRAWEWSENTGQFYLHTFLKEQPDVNWRNPDLRRAVFDVIRFWLDMGVDGFRLDVVNWFVKDDRFRDNPKKLTGLRPYDRQKHVYDRNRPETLDIMREIRKIVDENPDRMTVGEVFAEPPGDPELAASYYGNGDGLHMAFNFSFLFCPWKAEAFAAVVDQWETLLGADLWPNYTLSNHDQIRAISRYSRKHETLDRARVAAALLLTLRGTPFIYYGEEIGMRNAKIPRRRIQDPLGKRYWPFHPGRDGERTPMQWDASEHAGFSSAKPWLPVNSDFQETNVEKQTGAHDSLFNWYKNLIALRRSEPALQSGDYKKLFLGNKVYAYKRVYSDDEIIVVLNFSPKRRMIELPGIKIGAVLMRKPGAGKDFIENDVINLDGYDVLIAKTVKG